MTTLSEEEPKRRKTINKELHDTIFRNLCGKMTIPQARVHTTTMMYQINSHLFKYWSPVEAYCHKEQVNLGTSTLCDRDKRHIGEHSWELIEDLDATIAAHTKSIRQQIIAEVRGKLQKRQLLEPVTKRVVTETGDKVGIDLDVDMKGSLRFIQDNGYNQALDQINKTLDEMETEDAKTD